MSKLHHRKFARFFPAYHPRAGEPTYFVEKIVKSLHREGLRPWDIDPKIFSTEVYHIVDPKPHTIRAGHHVKPGDFIRMSVWSGKPYASKQIVIAPDVEVMKTWDFEIVDLGGVICIRLNNEPFGQLHPLASGAQQLSKNDGLGVIDFVNWFNKPFTGQIISWSDSVNY